VYPYRVLRREWLARNRARPDPLPICRACGRPTLPNDAHWLYHRECDNCGVNHLERVITRILQATGARKRTIRILRKLSRVGRATTKAAPPVL
jgi:hypothetical protein